MNKMAFELNFYDQGLRSYGLFSNVMQKHEINAGVMVPQTVRNGHIISCVLILFTSNEDQKIPYTLANQFI